MVAFLCTGPDNGIIATSLLSTDPVTGLIIPKSGAQMLLANGQLVDIPSDFFIHPQTSRVLPLHGNVAFDPMTSKLIFMVDSATGDKSLKFS